MKVQFIIILLIAFNLLLSKTLNNAFDFNKSNFSFKSVSLIFFNISLKVIPFNINISLFSIVIAVAVLFPFCISAISPNVSPSFKYLSPYSVLIRILPFFIIKNSEPSFPFLNKVMSFSKIFNLIADIIDDIISTDLFLNKK